MTNAPTDPKDVHTAGIYTMIGNFWSRWSTFEALVEILIMKELNISPQQTSILCSGQTIDPKLSLLQSLLNLKPENRERAAALQKVRTIAERNLFAHGIFQVNKRTGAVRLIRRENKGGHYKIDPKQFDFNQISKHFENFNSSVTHCESLFGVTQNDYQKYGQQFG